MLGGISAFLAIILFVLAHEAGHFFAAKATGMKATEFFFGFGPKLWSVQRGDTEYGVKLLPLGGYVRIAGMSPLEEVAPEDVGHTYRDKVFWKKTVVVLSGVMMNFVIAYLMFAGLNLAEGDPVPTTQISMVVTQLEDGSPSPASLAGAQPGDKIVAVDGTPTPTWADAAAALGAHPDENVVVTVERDGTQVELDAHLASRSDPATGVARGFFGVAPTYDRRPIGIFAATGEAGRQVVQSVGATMSVLGNLVKPDNLRKLAGGLVGNQVPDNIRPVSPIGVVAIGAQVGRIGIANFIGLLASVNIILGTVNVLPLYPLDGGHFAVALYEKLTGRRADVRKLAPIAAMVVALVVFIGLVAVVLDIVRPIGV